jgi:hypothetical protein
VAVIIVTFIVTGNGVYLKRQNSIFFGLSDETLKLKAVTLLLTVKNPIWESAAFT